MNDFIEYYTLLEIEPDATSDAIQEAIRHQRRIWNKRQVGQNLDSRQMAERKMHNLDAAEKILLNGAERRQYDDRRLEHQQQAASATQSTPQPQGGAATDWGQRAREFMDAGDLASANFAARESVQIHGNNDAAWSIRAHSALGLGEWREAEFSFREAIRLNPQNADYHFDLGCAYEAMNDASSALSKFQDAQDLDPSNPVYETATASIYIDSGQGDLIQEAVQIMSRVVKDHPDEQHYRYYLASALIDHPLAYATLVGDGTEFCLTSPEQVSRLRADVDKAESLNVDDRHIRQHIQSIRSLIDEAEQSTWHHPKAGARKAWITLFVILLIALFGGSIISIIVPIPLLALAIFGYVKLYRIPQWKANAKIVAPTVARWGVGPRGG